MAEENSLEIFHDVIEASIEFLYDEYKKKYFDLFFSTSIKIIIILAIYQFNINI